MSNKPFRTDTDTDSENHNLIILKSRLEKERYNNKVDKNKIIEYQIAIKNLLQTINERDEALEVKEKIINKLNFNRSKHEEKQLEDKKDIRDDFLLDKVY